jgi:hypothetical protein
VLVQVLAEKQGQIQRAFPMLIPTRRVWPTTLKMDMVVPSDQDEPRTWGGLDFWLLTTDQ